MLEQYLTQFTQQVEAYSRQLEMLQGRRLETATAAETLKSLADEDEPVVLLQIGGGASLRVKILDTDSVLLNIGSDVVVERTNAECTNYLESRITELEALEKKVAESIEQVQKQAKEVASRMEAAYMQVQSQMNRGA
ncbi:prefoldin subunit alpha [Methanomicrobiaceae archaeon CYW5]|uniref:prefoldin subunit alpha n=1 Tax=Methanovulcanius yangii TaxID=1789227 RepID=UPI0029CA5AA8|nr:prefoldin subunit alpha [Methanovulcanius yangii]MBT8507127.1 prefoldin subunit alpha [Methanovulcanius yangii]